MTPNASVRRPQQPIAPALPSLTGGFGSTTTSPFAGQLGRPQPASMSPYTPPAASHTMSGPQVVYEAQPAVSAPAVKPSIPAATPAAAPPPSASPAMPPSIVPQPRVPYVPSSPAGTAPATPATQAPAQDALARAAGNTTPLNPFLSGMGFQANNPDFNRRQSAMMAKQMRNWGGPQNLLAAMSVGGNAVYGMDRNQMQRQLGDRQFNVQRELGLGDQSVRRYASDNSLAGVRHTSDNALEGTRYTSDRGLEGVQDTNSMQRDRTAAEERSSSGLQATQRYGYDQVASSSAAANANERQKIDNAEAAAAHEREGAIAAKDRSRFNYYQAQATTARTPQERQYFQQQAESILNPGAPPRSGLGNNTPMDAMPFGAREQVQNMIAAGASPSQMQLVMRASGMKEDQINAVLDQANPGSFARPSTANPGGTFWGEVAPRSAGNWVGQALAIPTLGTSLIPQARQAYRNMRP